MSGPLPPGWPAGVRPPGSADWERSAVAWLFDLCPSDHRAHEVLQRHPLVLVRFAALHVEAGIAATEQGLRTARVDFVALPAETVEAAVTAWDRERQRLRSALISVRVVERALNGEPWVPRL